MHDGVNKLDIDEVNLGFCRMYIDIYLLRVNLDIKEIAGEAVLRYQLLIGVLHGMMKVRMLDKAGVHEEILLTPCLFQELRLHYKSVYRHRLRHLIDRQQLTVIIFSEEPDDTLFQSAGIEMEELLIIADIGEAHLRVHHCYSEELIIDMAELRIIRLQEVTSCRDIKEEVFHHE